MSGKDERRIQTRPQCQRCGLEFDIILRHGDGSTAGWILKEREKKNFGVAILVSRYFRSDSDITEAVCNACGLLSVDIVNKAIVFFKRELQAKRYITWDEWKVLRLER